MNERLYIRIRQLEAALCNVLDLCEEEYLVYIQNEDAEEVKDILDAARGVLEGGDEYMYEEEEK